MRAAPEQIGPGCFLSADPAEGEMLSLSPDAAALVFLRGLGGKSSSGVVGTRTRHGFTVIELLVVMGITAVLAVLTVLSFSALGKRTSRQGAADNVMGLLRGAQIAAVDSGLGSLVRIDTQERSLHGIASTVQAAWHFETQTVPASLPPAATGVTPGAKSMDGIVYGATAGQPGFAGLCFQFDGTSQYVDCSLDASGNFRNYPVYDQTEGIRIEAYVRPEATTGDYMGVIAKCYCPAAGIADPTSTGYILGVSRSGSPSTYRVHAGFVVKDATGAHGLVYVAYPPPPAGNPAEFRDGAWHRIAAEFDGYEARLFVDGLLVRSAAAPNPPAHLVPARTEALKMGVMHYGMPPFVAVNDYYFQGLIDEPQVLSVAGGSHFQLPEGVPLATSDPVVHYNGQGQLDTAYNPGPVYVTVGDPYQSAVLANDGGGALTLQSSNPFPPTGGAVVIGTPAAGYEVITYTNASGLTLDGTVGRGAYGTTSFPHSAGDTVYFARTVTVSAAGQVRQL